MFDHPLYGVSMGNPLDPILRIPLDIFRDIMSNYTVHSSDGQDNCEV